MKKNIFIATIFASVFLYFVSCKEDHKGMSGFQIENPWIRLVPSSSKITGGYLKITNHGESNQLVGAESSISSTVELHEMKESEGMMKMRKVEDGFPVGSHKSLVLQPGGNHLMFMGLTRELKEGEEIPVTLLWKRGETTSVQFTVRLEAPQSDGTGNPMHSHHD